MEFRVSRCRPPKWMLLALSATLVPSRYEARTCDAFIAPSLVPNVGTGVFAARRYERDELVEFSPLYVVIPEEQTRVVNETALEDYTHQHEGRYVVAFGRGMLYNHHPEPNLVWSAFGELPLLVGFAATRAIEPGEELLVSYGLEDRGKEWFRSRKIRPARFKHKAATRAATLREDARARCSKVLAGPGLKSATKACGYDENLMAWLRNQRIRRSDYGWGAAAAIHKLSPGDVIEAAPALPMRSSVLRATLLAPLVVEWAHLNQTQRDAFQRLQDDGAVLLHAAKDRKKLATAEISLEDVALLPLGTIAMVQRVGRESAEANCELRLGGIAGANSGGSASGIELTLVATRDVPARGHLKVALPVASDSLERDKLVQFLLQVGQPVPLAHHGTRRQKPLDVLSPSQSLKPDEL